MFFLAIISKKQGAGVIKKKYQLFILALVFVGTLLSSFHYHEDMHTAEECSVCIIQNVFAIADIPDHFVLAEISFFFLLPLLRRQRFVSLRPNLNLPSRAPPSFF